MTLWKHLIAIFHAALLELPISRMRSLTGESRERCKEDQYRRGRHPVIVSDGWVYCALILLTALDLVFWQQEMGCLHCS